MTPGDRKGTADLLAVVRRAVQVMPKWATEALFALLLVGLYFFAAIFVLPRLGFET